EGAGQDAADRLATREVTEVARVVVRHEEGRVDGGRLDARDVAVDSGALQLRDLGVAGPVRQVLVDGVEAVDRGIDHGAGNRVVGQARGDGLQRGVDRAQHRQVLGAAGLVDLAVEQTG